MYRRVKSGRSPFALDRTDILHVLLSAGYGKRGVLAIILAAQLFLGVALVVQNAKDETFAFFLIVVFIFAYQFLMRRSRRFIRCGKSEMLKCFGEG